MCLHLAAEHLLCFCRVLLLAGFAEHFRLNISSATRHAPAFLTDSNSLRQPPPSSPHLNAELNADAKLNSDARRL